MNIYIATSWRNPHTDAVVSQLRDDGHTVYDFRETGFSWGLISPDWEKWSSSDFLAAMKTPAAQEGFANDMAALDAADVVVLLLPSGNSAHIEVGYAVGRNRLTCVVSVDSIRPDLMYGMLGDMFFGPDAIELMSRWLGEVRRYYPKRYSTRDLGVS